VRRGRCRPFRLARLVRNIGLLNNPRGLCSDPTIVSCNIDVRFAGRLMNNLEERRTDVLAKITEGKNRLLLG
jgi:hypothetical protein